MLQITVNLHPLTRHDRTRLLEARRLVPLLVEAMESASVESRSSVNFLEKSCGNYRCFANLFGKIRYTRASSDSNG